MITSWWYILSWNINFSSNIIIFSKPTKKLKISILNLAYLGQKRDPILKSLYSNHRRVMKVGWNRSRHKGFLRSTYFTRWERHWKARLPKHQSLSILSVNYPKDQFNFKRKRGETASQLQSNSFFFFFFFKYKPCWVNNLCVKPQLIIKQLTWHVYFEYTSWQIDQVLLGQSGEISPVFRAEELLEQVLMGGCFHR